jgi:hypothetical protein
MFVNAGGPEMRSLPYDSDALRWRTTFYFSALKMRLCEVTRRASVCNRTLVAQALHKPIQSLLYQLRDQLQCNDLIRNYSRRTGVHYTYKMRLRPDYAWVRPIPHPRNLGLTAASILTTHGDAYCCGNNDSFAVGLAEPMDVYFSRAPHVHTLSHLERRGFVWTAERFLQIYLHAHGGIRLVQHPGLAALPVRTRARKRRRSRRATSAQL